jgi:hypothetical protein
MGVSDVHASAILADLLRLLRLIDESVFLHEAIPHSSLFIQLLVTYDSEKRSGLFGAFSLSSIKRINSGGEAVVFKTARAFASTMKQLDKNPSAVSFVISQRSLSINCLISDDP